MTIIAVVGGKANCQRDTEADSALERPLAPAMERAIIEAEEVNGMRKEEVLQQLKANAESLETFHVRHLAIFGSVARDEAQEGSDVDVLVEFEPGAPIGLLEFVRLRRFLSDILGCQVDLVTPNALHKEMKAQILQEAIDAA